MEFLTIISIVFVIAILSIIAMYNKMLKLKKTVEMSESTLDVYLKQRFDLIPNLKNITVEYAEYEKETITKLVELRADYLKDNSIANANKLNKEYATNMAIVENYPSLKANEQFLLFQKSLIKVENQIQAARRIYNIDVTNYNTYIMKFPQNLIANGFNFSEAELFEFTEK